MVFCLHRVGAGLQDHRTLAAGRPPVSLARFISIGEFFVPNLPHPGHKAHDAQDDDMPDNDAMETTRDREGGERGGNWQLFSLLVQQVLLPCVAHMFDYKEVPPLDHGESEVDHEKNRGLVKVSPMAIVLLLPCCCHAVAIAAALPYVACGVSAL